MISAMNPPGGRAYRAPTMLWSRSATRARDSSVNGVGSPVAAQRLAGSISALLLLRSAVNRAAEAVPSSMAACIHPSSGPPVFSARRATSSASPGRARRSRVPCGPFQPWVSRPGPTRRSTVARLRLFLAIPANVTVGTDNLVSSRREGGSNRRAPREQGDTAGYDPVAREFSLTEGAARGTRGHLGPRGRDQRGWSQRALVEAP